jgi:ribonuclease R
MLSEMIIEELMIAANEAVAAHIRDKGLPFPYRIHEKPGEDKIAYANILLKNFALAIEARQGGTQPYRQLLAKVKGKPEENVVSTLLLRSMDHAYYGIENRGHFGLASDCYCHFTSPIRRYPDLMVHRMLKQAAEKKKMTKPRAEAFRARMEEQCREASLRERIAEDAERKVDNLWKAGYMSRFVGEEFDGVVSGVTDYALFVALENTAEGMLHVSRLDGYYEYREELMALIHTRNNSRYRLGDPIRVKLESVDVGAGFINFCLPEREGI